MSIFFSTAFVSCTCASRADTRRETRPHNLSCCAGRSSTPTIAQYPLNQPKQFSDNITNVLAMSSVTESSTLQTYRARIATDISAAPQHGTHTHRPRTEPPKHPMGTAIQKSTRRCWNKARNASHKSVAATPGRSTMLRTHCAHGSTVALYEDKLRLRTGRMIRLVLHQSLLCIVLYSLQPHGSG